MYSNTPFKTTSFTSTLLRFALVLTTLLALGAYAHALEAKDLIGQWDAACTALDNGDGTTTNIAGTAVMTETAWSLAFTIHADEACEIPLFTVRNEGPYVLGATSAVADDTREGTFGFHHKTMTAHNDDIAAMLTDAGCADATWAAGDERDISATGCLFIPAVEPCPLEYDIVQVAGNTLRFGLRATDMCTIEGRPTALAPLGWDRR